MHGLMTDANLAQISLEMPSPFGHSALPAAALRADLHPDTIAVSAPAAQAIFLTATTAIFPFLMTPLTPFLIESKKPSLLLVVTFSMIFLPIAKISEKDMSLLAGMAEPAP